MSLVSRATCFYLAVGCLLAADSAAHADVITYNFAPTSSQIFFNGSMGAMRLLNTSGTLPSSGSIGTDVAAFSFAPPNMPQNVSMPVDLTLTDTTTGQAVSQQMGTLGGQLWSSGSGLGFSPGTPMTATLGGHQYTVSFASLQLAQNAGGTLGGFTFNVVDPPVGVDLPVPGVPITDSTTPEPSAFILAGIGVPLLGLLMRRRKR
jgi:hypothetical protein